MFSSTSRINKRSKNTKRGQSQLSSNYETFTWNLKSHMGFSTLMSLINVGLRLFFLRKYSRPYAVIPDPTFIYFWKKSLNIWVKIEKSGYFQQFLCLILQKFQALRLRLLSFYISADFQYIFSCSLRDTQ